MDTGKVVDLHKEDEDINVYGDLGEFDLGEEIEKLKEENRKLEKHIRSLNGNIGNLNTTLEKLKVTEGNLITNISNLYNTAVREVDRKDRLIEELRAELDNFYINRFNPNFRNKRKNRENSPSEFNVSKKYRFDECSVSIQNSSNDIKEIHIHKQENKYGNEDPSAVRQESKCDTDKSIYDKPDYKFDNEQETKQTDNRYYRPKNFNNRYSDNRSESSSRYRNNRYHGNENVDPRNEHISGKYKDEYKFKSRQSYMCSFDNEDRYGSRHQLSNNRNQYRNDERDDAYDNRNHRNNHGNSRNMFRHRSLIDRDEYNEVNRRSYYVNEKRSDRHDSEYNGQNRFSERQSHSRSKTPPVSNMKNERKEEENLKIKRRDPPEDTSALQSKPKKRLKMLDEMEKKIKQSRLSQAHNSFSDKKDSSSIYKSTHTVKQSLSDISSLTSGSEKNSVSNNKSKGNENLDRNNTGSKESLNMKESKRSKEGESPQVKSQQPKTKIEEKCSQAIFNDTALMDASYDLKSGKNLSCNRLPESPSSGAKANKSLKKTEDTLLNKNPQKYTNIKISDKKDNLIHILETGENLKNVPKQNLNSQETGFKESKSGESNNEFSINIINSLKALANDTSQKPSPKDSSLHTGVMNSEDYSQEFPDVEMNNKKNDPLRNVVHILEKSEEFVVAAKKNYKGIKESENKLQISTDIGISNKKSDPFESVVHILEKSEAFKNSAKKNLDCQETCCGNSIKDGSTNEFSRDEITKDRSEKPIQEVSSLNKLGEKQKGNPILSDINITQKRNDPLIDSIREESMSEIKNDKLNLLKASTICTSMNETPLNENVKKVEGKPEKSDINLINKEYNSFNNMVNILETSNNLGDMAESKDSTKTLINEYSNDKINLSKALENDISRKQISKNFSLNKDGKKIEDDPQKSTMKDEKRNSSKNSVQDLEVAKELKDVPKQNSNGQEKYWEESTNEESTSKVSEEKIYLSSVKQKVEDNAKKSTEITISNMKDDSVDHLIHVLETDKELRSIVKQNLNSQITCFEESSVEESINEFSKDIINLSKASEPSRHILAKKIGQAIPQDPNVLEKSNSQDEFYQKNIQYPETNKDKMNPQNSNIDSNLRKNVTEKSVSEVRIENTDSLKTILLKESTVSKITDKGERKNETQNLNELETRSRSIKKGAIIEDLQKNIDEAKVVKKAEEELFQKYPQDLSTSSKNNVERSIEMNDNTHKNEYKELILEKSVLQESTNEVSKDNINLSRNKSKHKRRTSAELSGKKITKKTKDHLLNDQPLVSNDFRMTNNNSNSYFDMPAQGPNVLGKSNSEDEFYQKNIQYPETNKDKMNPQNSNIDSNLRKNVTEKSISEVRIENTDSLKTILLKESTVSKITNKGERKNETQNLNELETRSRSIKKGAIIEDLQKNIDEAKVVKKAEEELFQKYPQDLSASSKNNVERSIEMNDNTHKNKYTELILEKSVLQESTNEVSKENINLSRNKSKHKRRTSAELSGKKITKKTKDHLLNEQPLDSNDFKMADNNSNSYLKIPAQDVNVREESIHLSLEVADVTKKQISEESSINTVGKRTERPLLSDNCLNDIALEKTYTSTISKSIHESEKHTTKPEATKNKISKDCRKENLSNFEASEKFSESNKPKSVVDIENEFIQTHIETDERVSRKMDIYDTKENPLEENSETSNHSSKNSVKKPPKQSITIDTVNKYYESNGKKGIVDSGSDNQESNRRRSRRKSTSSSDLPIELCQLDKNNKRIEEESKERIPTLETDQKSNKVSIEMLKSVKPVDNHIEENIKHKQKSLKNSKRETEAYSSVQIVVNKCSSHDKNHIRNSKTERLKEQSDLYKTLFGQPHGIINQSKDIKSDRAKNKSRESQVSKNVNEDAHQKLKVDDKCLKRKRRKSTVVEEGIYDKDKISISQEDYSRQNVTEKSKKRSLDDYEKFKKCQREKKEVSDNVFLSENGCHNIGELNKTSFSQKEQRHGVNRVKRRVTFCTVENKDNFNDQRMNLRSANLKDCDQLKAISGESTIKKFTNVVESMDTEDRNSISNSNENPDTSVKCETIERNNKKDCKNESEEKQRYFCSTSSGEEYLIPRVMGNVYGADSPTGVTPTDNSEILEESSYDIMGHCVRVQKLIEINDVKSEKSSLIDSVQSLSDSSSSEDTIVVCKRDDTTLVEEKVDMLIKHHKENYNNSEKQMLLENTVSTSDIKDRLSNNQINKTGSKVNIISMHSLKSSKNNTRNTSFGLLRKSQLDATSLSIDSDMSSNFGVVSSTSTDINSCSTSKSATDKERGHTTDRGNKSIHGIKSKKSSNIEAMETFRSLTSSRLHSIITTVSPNKTISANVTKEKITVENKESNDICKDQNSCHIESFATLASSTTDPPLTPTVNLSHDGEIPVLHLEENHINNLAPEVNINDKNIITLLDSMNISNVEGDIPCKATDTTINDNNVVNSDSDRDLTFGNIFEKVSSAASTVTNVSNSTSNLQSERPPAFRRRRRCRLVIKD